MDFQQYLTNLDSQLKAVNSDITEKQEELDKLKEFRSRIKGGIEVVKQIQSDAPPVSTKEEIRKSVQELAQLPAQQGENPPKITP
jgi:septal ring factor EnvC (AmiA/AmiB activator)